MEDCKSQSCPFVARAVEHAERWKQVLKMQKDIHARAIQEREAERQKALAEKELSEAAAKKATLTERSEELTKQVKELKGFIATLGRLCDVVDVRSNGVVICTVVFSEGFLMEAFKAQPTMTAQEKFLGAKAAEIQNTKAAVVSTKQELTKAKTKLARLAFGACPS